MSDSKILFFLIPYNLGLPNDVVGRISTALPALAPAKEKSLLFYLWQDVTGISPLYKTTKLSISNILLKQ